ncbi:Flp family type IVb pilin [Methylobacterium sp. WL120]|uniref:Flp family type IVb pilin n=1 Tax=Methylobacterium sp. WL120 TaxID=2603887 RepID=UPI001FEF2B43|nr:Flp family type IVb pilin [Methylobacterium sp. WL120]
MSGPVVEMPERAGTASPIRRFAADVRGATSIEYALIAGFVFLVAVGSIRLYASRVGQVYATIGNTISQN